MPLKRRVSAKSAKNSLNILLDWQAIFYLKKKIENQG